MMNGPARATCVKFVGVASFLDLAGFTKLTERLALLPDGAERLAKVINTLIGRLLDTLKTGDVVKFSGDAILVLYEATESECLADAARRAISEGLSALRADYSVSPSDLGDDPDGPGMKLALHAAITAGNLEMIHVGGGFGRWECVMTGEAMRALGPTADRAPTDYLCIDPKTHALIAASPTPLFDMSVLPGTDDSGGTYAHVLREIPQDGGSRDFALAPMLAEATSNLKNTETLHSVARRAVVEMGPEAITVLGRYVPPLIQRAISAKVSSECQCPSVQSKITHTDFMHPNQSALQALHAVSSFADLSVLFVGISGVDLGSNHPISGELWGQVVMATVQECVYNHEGAVNKFVMDDKGALLLCAWGLPPMTHVDDPRRSVASAVQLAAAFSDLGVEARIGVATGNVFAGVIGRLQGQDETDALGDFGKKRGRCEFSMLGDSVNLAARLMGKSPVGGVLIDEATALAAGEAGYPCEDLGEISVKGKDNPVRIYAPKAVEEARDSDDDDDDDDDKAAAFSTFDKTCIRSSATGASSQLENFVVEGNVRLKERQMLSDMLDGLFQHGGGQLLLTGDAGSGFSELAVHVLKSASVYGAILIDQRTHSHQSGSARICFEYSKILRTLLAVDVDPDACVDVESSTLSHEGAIGGHPSDSDELLRDAAYFGTPGNLRPKRGQHLPRISSSPCDRATWKQRLEDVLTNERPELLPMVEPLLGKYLDAWANADETKSFRARFDSTEESPVANVVGTPELQVPPRGGLTGSTSLSSTDTVAREGEQRRGSNSSLETRRRSIAEESRNRRLSGNIESITSRSARGPSRELSDNAREEVSRFASILFGLIIQ